MYITSNSFVSIESYVPSVSKVGARGLVLSLQYMSRVKEEGEVRLHEGEGVTPLEWYRYTIANSPKPVKVKLIVNLDVDPLFSGHNAHLSDHHRKAETYQVYMQFLQYDTASGGID